MYLSTTNHTEKKVDYSFEETFYRGTGNGGQHRNKTESDVKLVELNTGISVSVQGRSQWKNRQKAKELLNEKLTVENSKRQTQERRTNKNMNRDVKSFQWVEWRNETKSLTTGKKIPMDKALKGKMLNKLE